MAFSPFDRLLLDYAHPPAPFSAVAAQHSIHQCQHRVQGEAPCKPGDPVTKGQKVRLHHTETKKWLHSHNFRSPLSQQWEVSAYGSPRQSDTGDTWAVTWDGKATTWDASAKVRSKLLAAALHAQLQLSAGQCRIKSHSRYQMSLAPGTLTRRDHRVKARACIQLATERPCDEAALMTSQSVCAHRCTFSTRTPADG